MHLHTVVKVPHIPSFLRQFSSSQVTRSTVKTSRLVLKMRSSILISGFAALTAAQNVDWSQVTAAPAVVVTEAPVTGTAQTVSAQPSTAASSVGSAAVQSSPIAQRGSPRTRKARWILRSAACWNWPNCQLVSSTYPACKKKNC